MLKKILDGISCPCKRQQVSSRMLDLKTDQKGQQIWTELEIMMMEESIPHLDFIIYKHLGGDYEIWISHRKHTHSIIIKKETIQLGALHSYLRESINNIYVNCQIPDSTPTCTAA